jgi:hypothetical protein
MNTTKLFHTYLHLPLVAGLFAFLICTCFGARAGAETQQSFASPEEAVTGLVQTLQKGDAAALTTLFGPGAEGLVASGDAVADAADRAKFVDMYNEKHVLVPAGSDKVELQVGADGWPLPVPIVRRAGRWYFDGASGAQELVYRRIGHNELGAIRVARGYVDAQIDYAATGRDGNPAGIYAQKLRSDPGMHNGLYWPSAAGEPDSPVGPFIAQAAAEGYQAATGPSPPYHGYQYRPLFRQGSHAKGGALEYFVDGNLVNGFALVAWPATYGVSGVMTFIVSQGGVVYQKDLGSDTAKLVDAMYSFDPDSTWTVVKDSTQ